MNEPGRAIGFRRAAVDDALLLVVDLQAKLLPAIHEHERVLTACGRMIRAAHVMHVPVLATEQYRAGLGPTVPAIAELLADAPVIEKLTFSACGIEPVRTRLAEAKRSQVIVIGIEAHVCIQQTVLDLLEAGYAPMVPADAVSSRRPFDAEVALRRMTQAGAVVTTTESLIFELCREAGTPLFKELLPLVK